MYLDVKQIDKCLLTAKWTVENKEIPDKKIEIRKIEIKENRGRKKEKPLPWSI